MASTSWAKAAFSWPAATTNRRSQASRACSSATTSGEGGTGVWYASALRYASSTNIETMYTEQVYY